MSIKQHINQPFELVIINYFPTAYTELNHFKQQIIDKYKNATVKYHCLDQFEQILNQNMSQQKNQIILLLLKQINSDDPILKKLEKVEKSKNKIIIYPQPVEGFEFASNKYQIFERINYLQYSASNLRLAKEIKMIGVKRLVESQKNLPMKSLGIKVYKSKNKQFKEYMISIYSKYKNNPCIEILEVRDPKQIVSVFNQKQILIVCHTDLQRILPQLQSIKNRNQKIHTILFNTSKQMPQIRKQFNLITTNVNMVIRQIQIFLEKLNNTSQNKYNHPKLFDQYYGNIISSNSPNQQINSKSLSPNVNYRIRLNSAKKYLKSSSNAITKTFLEPNILVYQNGNPAFKSFYQGLLIKPNIIRSLPNTVSNKTIILASYSDRKTLLNNLNNLNVVRNFGFIFYGEELEPDPIIRNSLVELATSKAQQIRMYLAQSNVKLLPQGVSNSINNINNKSQTKVRFNFTQQDSIKNELTPITQQIILKQQSEIKQSPKAFTNHNSYKKVKTQQDFVFENSQSTSKKLKNTYYNDSLIVRRVEMNWIVNQKLQNHKFVTYRPEDEEIALKPSFLDSKSKINQFRKPPSRINQKKQPSLIIAQDPYLLVNNLSGNKNTNNINSNFQKSTKTNSISKFQNEEDKKIGNYKQKSMIKNEQEKSVQKKNQLENTHSNLQLKSIPSDIQPQTKQIPSKITINKQENWNTFQNLQKINQTPPRLKRVSDLKKSQIHKQDGNNKQIQNKNNLDSIKKEKLIEVTKYQQKQIKKDINKPFKLNRNTSLESNEVRDLMQKDSVNETNYQWEVVKLKNQKQFVTRKLKFQDDKSNNWPQINEEKISLKKLSSQRKLVQKQQPLQLKFQVSNSLKKSKYVQKHQAVQLKQQQQLIGGQQYFEIPIAQTRFNLEKQQKYWVAFRKPKTTSFSILLKNQYQKQMKKFPQNVKLQTKNQDNEKTKIILEQTQKNKQLINSQTPSIKISNNINQPSSLLDLSKIHTKNNISIPNFLSFNDIMESNKLGVQRQQTTQYEIKDKLDEQKEKKQQIIVINNNKKYTPQSVINQQSEQFTISNTEITNQDNTFVIQYQYEKNKLNNNQALTQNQITTKYDDAEKKSNHKIPRIFKNKEKEARSATNLSQPISQDYDAQNSASMLMDTSKKIVSKNKKIQVIQQNQNEQMSNDQYNLSSRLSPRVISNEQYKNVNSLNNNLNEQIKINSEPHQIKVQNGIIITTIKTRNQEKKNQAKNYLIINKEPINNTKKYQVNQQTSQNQNPKFDSNHQIEKQIQSNRSIESQTKTIPITYTYSEQNIKHNQHPNQNIQKNLQRYQYTNQVLNKNNSYGVNYGIRQNQQNSITNKSINSQQQSIGVFTNITSVPSNQQIYVLNNKGITQQKLSLQANTANSIQFNKNTSLSVKSSNPISYSLASSQPFNILYLIHEKLQLQRNTVAKISNNNETTKIILYKNSEQLKLIPYRQYNLVFLFPFENNNPISISQIPNLYIVRTRCKVSQLQIKTRQIKVKEVQQLVEISKFLATKKQSVQNVPIQLIFKKLNSIIQQVSHYFSESLYKIYKYFTINQLLVVSKKLDPQQIIILITDQIPQNIDIFKDLPYFTSVVVPKGKYKAHQLKYPKFKWINGDNPQIIAKQINQYLTQYKIIAFANQNSIRKNIDKIAYCIRIKQNLKNQIPIEPHIPSIIVKYFKPQNLKQQLSKQKKNIIVTDTTDLQKVENQSSTNDKLIVYLNQNESLKQKKQKVIFAHKNKKQIILFLKKILEEENFSHKQKMKIFYHYEDDEIEEFLQKKYPFKFSMIKYNDYSSIVKKLVEFDQDNIFIILNGNLIKNIPDLKNIKHKGIINMVIYQKLNKITINTLGINTVKNLTQLILQVQRRSN